MTITESRQHALAVAIANLESSLRCHEEGYILMLRRDTDGTVCPDSDPLPYPYALKALVAWRKARVAELMETQL